MILYVNGDSHSAGHHAGGPEYSYGKHIATNLNAEFVCDALPGCSNDIIISSTKKYLESNTPDFIIIGWSTWERETWYYNDHTYHISSSGLDKIHPDLQAKYKQWVIDNGTPEVQHAREYEAHNKIWEFHQLLLERKIPHLFFNCYSYFLYTNAFDKPKFDWAEYYIDPYNKDSTYYFWLANKGFTPSNPTFYHYGADAHVAWADFLLPKVKNLLT